LIAAYVTEERTGGRARTAREFVAEFDGLKRTAKQKAVTDAAKLSGAFLRDLVDGQDIAEEPVRLLLTAMQHESREVNPTALGVLGETHVTQCLVRYYGVEDESCKYKKLSGVVEGMPFVLEVGCGCYIAERSALPRETIIGLNFTPCLKDPLQELTALLGEARVDRFDPVMVLVHLTSPRLDFTDRGKSTLNLPADLRAALADAMTAVTKPWKALKRQADREERVRERDLEHYRKQHHRQYLSVKAAAYQVMEEAYLWAGGANGLPANARQIMYAARRLILDRALTAHGRLWKKSSYFTQHLLPDFMEEHPGLTTAWDVVFDDRGHFKEPHTGRRIGVGTLAVRGYVNAWECDVDEHVDAITLDYSVPTVGPGNRYRFVLFVEKEGFNPLLEKAQIAERYDLAIMSTKGMSVTAARQLVEELTEQAVTMLVMRDFDKAGFSIVHTLRSSTRRHTYTRAPQVIDLGLRLGDVQALHLDREAVEYDSTVDPRINLRESGATEEECAVLVRRTAGGWRGERVELNAMSSRQLLAWLEAKFAEHGVEKVVPDQATLEQAYRRARRRAVIQHAIDAALKTIDQDDTIAIPASLAAHIRAAISGTTQSWDMAIWQMVNNTDSEEEQE
jgi:hypothetical protein